MIQEIHESRWVLYAITYRISRKGRVSRNIILRCGQQLRDRTRCEHVMVEQPGFRTIGVHVRVWPDDLGERF